MFLLLFLLFLFGCTRKMASQVALVVKNHPANAGDVTDSTRPCPGSGRSPGVRHGSPLQHSCLENPIDRGVWFVMVHMVAKSQKQLKQLHMHVCTEREKLHFLFWWGSYKGMIHHCWWPLFRGAGKYKQIPKGHTINNNLLNTYCVSRLNQEVKTHKWTGWVV